MKKNCIWVLIVCLSLCCNKNDDSFMFDQLDTNQIGNTNNDDPFNNTENSTEIKILSLGDSYTIGQSVCQTCKFPVQLKDSLENQLNRVAFVEVIAQTGWTTSDLIDAISSTNPSNDHDLVTLLIGVNNQYQGKPFSLYIEEFPYLIDQAIAFGKGNPENLIVISIPDYAFTLFGQNSGNPLVTSSEIDEYNAYAENYCLQNDITFVNITDITRQGLDNPDLVASDNLHPSELAYTLFVERLLPIAINKLN